MGAKCNDMYPYERGRIFETHRKRLHEDAAERDLKTLALKTGDIQP